MVSLGDITKAAKGVAKAGVKAKSWHDAHKEEIGKAIETTKKLNETRKQIVQAKAEADEARLRAGLDVRGGTFDKLNKHFDRLEGHATAGAQVVRAGQGMAEGGAGLTAVVAGATEAIRDEEDIIATFQNIRARVGQVQSSEDLEALKNEYGALKQAAHKIRQTGIQEPTLVQEEQIEQQWEQAIETDIAQEEKALGEEKTREEFQKRIEEQQERAKEKALHGVEKKVGKKVGKAVVGRAAKSKMGKKLLKIFGIRLTNAAKTGGVVSTSPAAVSIVGAVVPLLINFVVPVVTAYLDYQLWRKMLYTRKSSLIFAAISYGIGVIPLLSLPLSFTVLPALYYIEPHAQGIRRFFKRLPGPVRAVVLLPKNLMMAPFRLPIIGPLLLPLMIPILFVPVIAFPIIFLIAYLQGLLLQALLIYFVLFVWGFISFLDSVMIIYEKEEAPEVMAEKKRVHELAKKARKPEDLRAALEELRKLKTMRRLPVGA